MRRYQVTLTGATPLLIHGDNVNFREVVKEWQKDPANKAKSVAGDDRSPAWTWVGYCYHDREHMTLPSDNLMTCIRDGAKKVPTGKRGASYKAQSQSGILVDQIGWPIETPLGFVPWDCVEMLVDEPDFKVHLETAVELGFELFVKPAKIGRAKHIRVRPRFDTWSATGTVTILDDDISEAILRTILTQSGSYVGIGDWRPGSIASGQFGRFVATVEKIKS